MGQCIGPTLSGFLVEVYGFEWTSMVFAGLHFSNTIVQICELAFNVILSKYYSSYEKM